jgi:DNA-binding CsgD family transcriptional regulator/PAS domain-containing protein
LLPFDEDLSQILQALYDAPLEPSRWEDFLRLTAQASGGEAAALMLLHAESCSVARSVGLDPEVTRLYEQHYYRLDVWREPVTRASDWLGTSERYVSFAELERTEFYNDFALPAGIPHAIAAMVERGPERIANLGIYRGLRAGAFEKGDLDVVRFLKPHLQRAHRLHTELNKAQARSAGLAAALNTLSTGVILLGPHMRVVAMNQAAEQFVAIGNGLLVSGDTVALGQSKEAALLQCLIASAVRTGEGTGLQAGGAVTVSRHDLPPLHVLVSPVRGFDLDESHPVRAILFVKDTAQRSRHWNGILSALFGLTPAECRVAILLADGYAPKQIVETIGVSRNTLKSQLSSIFCKTGTSRQSQLVRLLAQLSSV